MEERKKFLKPKIDVIEFEKNDIITLSGEDTVDEGEYPKLP